MRVTLLPSCFAPGCEAHQYLTSFLINEELAIDAGSLGLALTTQQQAAVRNVLITHSHADHVATLPIFIENVYRTGPQCVTVRGSEAVIDGLKRDVFNGRTWPDFVELSQLATPFLHLEPFTPGKTFELSGLRITPVEVCHAVPTCGFILEDNHSAVIITSDTGPTEEIWERANQLPNLKAVFMEASFPNSMTKLAELSCHLTPALFAAEARKLKQQARFIAVHLKPRFYDVLVSELTNEIPQGEVVQPGVVYEF